MRKLLVAAALLLSFSSVAMAKKTDPLVVQSGSVQAMVDGKMLTFSKGQAIPEGAAITATADAVIESHGMVLTVPAGTSFQASRTDSGLIDIRTNSGSAITVKGYGNTTVLAPGAEANVSGGNIQAIAGNVSVTTTGYNGQKTTQTLGAGQQIGATGISGSNTVLGVVTGTVQSILPPPPPNPTQNNKVAPVVSPSSPS